MRIDKLTTKSQEALQQAQSLAENRHHQAIASLSAASRKQSRRMPPGLVRVRKELPPPAKIFKSKKKDKRKYSNEELRRELLESLL